MDQKELVFSDVHTQLYQTIGPTYVRRHLPDKTDLNDAYGLHSGRMVNRWLDITELISTSICMFLRLV